MPQELGYIDAGDRVVVTEGVLEAAHARPACPQHLGKTGTVIMNSGWGICRVRLDDGTTASLWNGIDLDYAPDEVRSPASRGRASVGGVGQQDFSLDRLHELVNGWNVVLRHDVDYSIECARRMAVFEAERSVKASFFFLVNGQYNLRAYGARKALREIRELGHEVCAHVDMGLPRDELVSSEMMADAAIAAHWGLCELLEIPESEMSRRISFHQPPRDVFWREVPGFESMTGPFWKGHYVQDSRGVFRLSPEEAIAKATKERPVQLNLHPEWWFWPKEYADRRRLIEESKP